MTGPEHYQEAERLIGEAHESQANNGPGCGSEEILAEAQVHATLALAAATAIAMYGTENGWKGMPLRDYEAWDHAAGVAPL